jgi:hypothetical protein
VAVDHYGRVRLVGFERPLDGDAKGLQLGGVDLCFEVGGGEAGCLEQAVSVAQGEVEHLAEADHHLTARPRAAGL